MSNVSDCDDSVDSMPLTYSYCTIHNTKLFFLWRNSPSGTQTESFLGYLDHTQAHHNRYGSSEWGIGPTQRPLPDYTQNSQETAIHDPCGIRTNPQSQQASGRIVCFDRASTAIGNINYRRQYMKFRNSLSNAYRCCHVRVPRMSVHQSVTNL